MAFLSSKNISETLLKLKNNLKPFFRCIKNKHIRWLYFYFNGKIINYTLKKEIFKYYSLKKNENITEEEKEVLNYLKNNSVTSFPYDFVKKYKNINIDVLADDKNGLRYVVSDNKKLYFKRSLSGNQIKKVYSNLLMEQDDKSPHKYLSEDFCVLNDDIVVDIGAAEGSFSLKVVEKAKKIYLFESDPELVEALNATFEPWKSKVFIINKYVSNKEGDGYTTIDAFFKDKELPNFIKIDVEGAEYDLLRGGITTLSNKQPIKVAIATYHRHGDDKKLANELIGYDFTIKYSKGYTLSIWDDVLKEPYFRRALIKATK